MVSFPEKGLTFMTSTLVPSNEKVNVTKSPDVQITSAVLRKRAPHGIWFSRASLVSLALGPVSKFRREDSKQIKRLPLSVFCWSLCWTLLYVFGWVDVLNGVSTASVHCVLASATEGRRDALVVVGMCVCVNLYVFYLSSFPSFVVVFASSIQVSPFVRSSVC